MDLVVAEEVPVTESPKAGIQINPDLAGGDADELPDGVYREGVVLPEDRVELFRVNGKLYTVPRRVNPKIAFRYLRDLRRGGSQEMAAANIMYEVLGDGVMDALADEDLSDEEMRAVMKAVEKHTMSVMKKTLGN